MRHSYSKTRSDCGTDLTTRAGVFLSEKHTRIHAGVANAHIHTHPRAHARPHARTQNPPTLSRHCRAVQAALKLGRVLYFFIEVFKKSFSWVLIVSAFCPDTPHPPTPTTTPTPRTTHPPILSLACYQALRLWEKKLKSIHKVDTLSPGFLIYIFKKWTPPFVCYPV